MRQSTDDELMDMAEAHEKWILDWNSRLDDAEMKGIAIGEKRGQEKGLKLGEEIGLKLGEEIGLKLGEEKSKLQTAKMMCAEGIEISVISRVTGLSEEQINKL